MNYLIGAAMMLSAVACEPGEETKQESFPELDSLEDTLWWSTTTDLSGKTLFFDLTFNDSDDGTLATFDSAERTNRIDYKLFDYSFNATNDTIHVVFDDGSIYDGYLIQKGHFQVNEINVYAIQLLEVDANGQIIVDDYGKPASSMIFWRE